MGKIKKLIEKNPKKFKRTLFFSLIALSLVAFLFLPNVVYADGIGNLLDSELHARDLNQLIKTISHIVYVFIWPCLAIAGAALDNSLVYGSFLHLDAALWNIWNIMKNLANFALGFVFIFTIVKNLFAGSFGGSSNDPIQGAKKVIEKTLISGVLVQMSWFIVAALIDLSTILIYAVGGIPLSMLGSYDNEVADVPIMKLNAVMEENDFFYYYSYGGHNYSPCFVANKQGDVDTGHNAYLQGLEGTEYIVGRERLYMSDGVTEFESGYCALNGYLYQIKELVSYSGEGSGYDRETGNNVEYFNHFKDYLNINATSGDVLDLKEQCYFINAYNKEYKTGANNQCLEVCSGLGEVSYTGDVFTESENGFKLKSLIENSKGWVGPFVTMYSSILNYQELVMNPDSGSVMGTLFGLIINTFFALILFIPVAVLMVLLIIRIGFLWIVVAISPVLILVNFGPLPDKIKSNDIFKKFKIEEIIKQIFLPVVVVFAVSLCIVFLSAIYKSKPNYDNASQTLSAFGIEKVGTSEVQSSTGCAMAGKNMTRETYSILGLVTVNINAQNYNHGKDIFVWVLMELLATGIVWFFMKFAITAMSDKGKKLMSTAEKFVTTLPLIQLPGVEGKVGLHALGIGEGNQDKMINNLDSKVRQLTNADSQDEALRRRFEGDNTSSSDSESSVSIAEAINYVRSNNQTFGQLDDRYRKALESAGFNESVLATVRSQEYGNLLDAGKGLQTPTKDKTNADALQFTRDQLNTAVKSDPNWISWARGMVAGSVQTREGVFMVDIVEGTENHPIYEILDREKYEKKHFGNNDKTIDKIDKTTYEANQAAINKYLDELKQELERLGELERDRANGQLGDNQNLYDRLSELKRELEGKNFAVEEIRQYLGLGQ